MAGGPRDIALVPLYHPTSTTGTNPTGVGWVDLQPYYSSPMEIEAWLDVGTITGTQGTLAVVIQDSTDGSTLNTTVATFANVTTATGAQGIFFRTNNRYVQAVATASGTSPNFNFHVMLQIHYKVV